VIVLDCRDGEPDRSGAAAVFEGFFDLETGEPRRPGMGIPRLRVIAPAAPAAPAALALSAPSAALAPSGAPALAPVSPPADETVDPPAAASALAAAAVPAVPAVPVRLSPPSVERLWGFECWWRPDPGRSGLTPSDHEDLEQSKRLLRGLLRDTRRAGRSLQPR